MRLIENHQKLVKLNYCSKYIRSKRFKAANIRLFSKNLSPAGKWLSMTPHQAMINCLEKMFLLQNTKIFSVEMGKALRHLKTKIKPSQLKYRHHLKTKILRIDSPLKIKPVINGFGLSFGLSLLLYWPLCSRFCVSVPHTCFFLLFPWLFWFCFWNLGFCLVCLEWINCNESLPLILCATFSFGFIITSMAANTSNNVELDKKIGGDINGRISMLCSKPKWPPSSFVSCVTSSNLISTTPIDKELDRVWLRDPKWLAITAQLFKEFKIIFPKVESRHNCWSKIKTWCLISAIFKNFLAAVSSVHSRDCSRVDMLTHSDSELSWAFAWAELFWMITRPL